MKSVKRTFASAALAASIALLPPALAQTHAGQGSLASVKPVAASVTACATGLIEIAPVSFDTTGRPDAWVVVHRVKGEVVSAERVTSREIEQLHRSPCGADSRRGAMLEG